VSLERFAFHGNGEPLYLFVSAQFPRESATRFSRENRSHFSWNCFKSVADFATLSEKTVASRHQKVLKTASAAFGNARSGCARQMLMICCRSAENE